MMQESTEIGAAKTHQVATSKISAKWGDAAALGFLAIPDALLINQAKLELDATQTLVLFNVLSHWWFKDHKPFPRTSTIARRMGVSSRTVQRALNSLLAKKVLAKVKNENGKTAYDPAALVQKLEILVQQNPRFSKQEVLIPT